MLWIIPAGLFFGALLYPKAAGAGLFTAQKIYGPFLPPGGLPVNKTDLDKLARTAWGEARGEGSTGMQVVINVIMNRYRQRPRYGGTVAEICTRAKQFSCWNASDPNRKKLLAVTTADPQYAEAVRLATLALQGKLIDISGGADHYHTPAVAPPWSKGVTPVRVVGNHRLFNLTGTA